jgi:hypothetical protein
MQVIKKNLNLTSNFHIFDEFVGCSLAVDVELYIYGCCYIRESTYAY